jgi:hypothetical protein
MSWQVEKQLGSGKAHAMMHMVHEGCKMRKEKGKENVIELSTSKNSVHRGDE